MQQLLEKHISLIGNKIQFILDFFGIDDIDKMIVSHLMGKTSQVFAENKSKFFEGQRFDIEFEADVLGFLHQLVLEMFDAV